MTKYGNSEWAHDKKNAALTVLEPVLTPTLPTNLTSTIRAVILTKLKYLSGPRAVFVIKPKYLSGPRAVFLTINEIPK